MAEDTNTRPIDALETQISAVSDTNTNLRGLIEKIARIQADLSAADLDGFAEKLGDSFSALSGVADDLQEVGHDLEIERNRLASEG
ncbi:MAG: hypothetical protein ACR2GQ_04880 [Gemmatimonadota bacterium]